jgi:hypothetical protein
VGAGECCFENMLPGNERGGKAYRFSFKIQNFRDLKEKIDEHSGSYLLDLSVNDREIIDIFGR